VEDARKHFNPSAEEELRYVDLGAKTGTINGATDRYSMNGCGLCASSEGTADCITVMTAHGEKSACGPRLARPLLTGTLPVMNRMSATLRAGKRS
jgi:hypothetical protein